MIQEFKEFISRGNMIDLAVAVVLGAAFAPVIGALVDRVLMPLIGLIFDEPNFNNFLTFANGEGSVGAVITALVNFLFVGLALFFVVKAYNRMRSPAPPEGDPEDIVLLREIRDQLARR